MMAWAGGGLLAVMVTVATAVAPATLQWQEQPACCIGAVPLILVR